jgi:hypothetical protein
MAFGLSRSICCHHLTHALECLDLGELGRTKINCFGITEYALVGVAEQTGIGVQIGRGRHASVGSWRGSASTASLGSFIVLALTG